MKTLFTLAAIFASAAISAQPYNNALSSSSCINPVNLHAENIKTNSALLVWQRYDQNAVSFNLIWRIYGTTKWDSVFNIPDTMYLLKNLKVNTQYEFKVASVCNNGMSKYKLKNVFSTLAKGGYCAAHSNSLTYIQSVRLNSKTNISGSNSNGYGDYTNIVFPLAVSKTYTIYVKPLKTNIINDSVTISIYADFNQNKSLSDADELIGRKSSLGSKELSFKFTVPATAAHGSTRMRIVVEESYFAYNNACNYTNGEAEDYTVNISGETIADIDQSSMAENEKAVIAVKTNPVQNNNALIGYSLSEGGNVQLMIINQSGKTMKLVKQGMQLKGSYNLQLNTGNINQGNYTLVLMQNNNIVARTGLVLLH